MSLRVGRRLGGGELVRVEREEGDALPQAFRWRGRRYRVRAIEGYREEGVADRSGGRPKRFYRVRTAEGLRVVLCQGPGAENWRMEAVLGHEGGQR